ncbi:SDR family NAD(P)-dependent oxidoreductase [Pendulispora brunnea]|uniref:SDR family NAD(P)-dependent oxidoreductase n=1 Tax=Pendulispora brunnea TaxID=2905690 RepID=A0ABZ2KJ76_9BACT
MSSITAVAPVALVLGIEEGTWASGGFSRTMALTLSAHGVAVVVVGKEERPLGEAVGEVVYSGGRGRHFVGDPRAREDLEAAIEKARSAFGRLDLVVAVAGEANAEVMGALGPALASRSIACEAVFLRGGTDEVDVEARAKKLADGLT